LKTKSKSLLF